MQITDLLDLQKQVVLVGLCGSFHFNQIFFVESTANADFQPAGLFYLKEVQWKVRVRNLHLVDELLKIQFEVLQRFPQRLHELFICFEQTVCVCGKAGPNSTDQIRRRDGELWILQGGVVAGKKAFHYGLSFVLPTMGSAG